MDEYELGKSTFTILRHFGFRVLLANVERMDFASIMNDASSAENHPSALSITATIDIVMQSDDTTVSRCVPLQDLWEDAEGILVAAIAIREFFLGDR
jgi:hypothetical protein